MNRRMGLAFALVLGLGASRAEPATLQKVAVDGDPAPDPGSFYRRKFLQPAVSDAAGAHVMASARIFINRTCLVKFDAGPDSIVVCRKDVSPEGHEANVNDGLRTSGTYIRRAAGGTIETVARINDVAPGVSPTVQFRLLVAPSMSPGGKVAFRAKLRPLGGPHAPHEGIFLFE